MAVSLPLYLAPPVGFEPTAISLEESGAVIFFEFYFQYVHFAGNFEAKSCNLFNNSEACQRVCPTIVLLFHPSHQQRHCSSG